jgi:hypothetical protein
MTFIMRESNIRQFEWKMQKDDVSTLIIMINIIHPYDSV